MKINIYNNKNNKEGIINYFKNYINTLTPELNPSGQHCLTKLFY
jgi:hypothetical protein